MRNLRVAVVLLAIMAVSSVASAGVLFEEDFDAYATGSSLHGQGGWKGWDNNPAWTAFTDPWSLSPPNSANISGLSDLVHEFSYTGGILELSAMQYIPDGSSGWSYFMLMDLYNDGGPFGWSVQLKFDMTSGQVVSELFGGFVSVPIQWDTWVQLRFEIDLANSTVSEYYDGTLLSTHPWGYLGPNDTFQAIDLYANNADPIYYDDFSISDDSVAPVPVPATVLLLGTGLAGLAGFRRKHRKR